MNIDIFREAFIRLKGKLQIIDVLFIFSLFSIFLNIPIYPIFFTSVIIVGIYSLYKDGFRKSLKEVKLNQWLLASFLLWAVVITLIRFTDYPSILIKLILNLVFLLIFSLIIQKRNNESLRRIVVKSIRYIIILNFIQLLWIYIPNNLFYEVLFNGGFENSITRYVISEYSHIIGISNKNIWAVKLALFQILYLYDLSYHEKVGKSNYILVFISIFNMLFLLSRTAQVVYILALVYFVFERVNRVITKKIKIVFYTIGGVILLGIGYIFVDKILNIKLDVTDGGYVRLIYWQTFFENITKTHFLTGNGLLSARAFLEAYSPYYIGESNMHNVFLNTWLDFGLIGLILYIGFLGGTLYWTNQFRININFIFIIVVPLLFSFMLQYLGYDNDIVLYILCAYLISQINNKAEVS